MKIFSLLPVFATIILILIIIGIVFKIVYYATIIIIAYIVYLFIRKDKK